MAEKARNLRKLLSKNKDKKTLQQFNTQPNEEADPLNYLNNDNTTKANCAFNNENEFISELVMSKVKEGNEEQVTTKSFRASVIQANSALSKKSKLFEKINQLQQIKQNEEKVYAVKEEGKQQQQQLPKKIGLSELNEAQKRKTMSRMASAQLNLQKGAGKFGGSDLVKKASDVILNKAKQLESKISNDNIDNINSNNIGLKIFNHIKHTVDSTVFTSMNSIQREQDEINQVLLMRRNIHS